MAFIREVHKHAFRNLKKNVKYIDLFQNLYSEYKDNPSSEKIWKKIMDQTKPFKNKFLSSSKIYSQLYPEATLALNEAVLKAFRTYNNEKGASFYTWLYRMCWQASIMFIKAHSNQPALQDNYFAPIEEDSSPEDLVVSFEEEERVSGIEKELSGLKEKLTGLLGGPLEFEVFCKSFGIFGEERLTLKKISEDSNLSYRTVHYIRQKNKKILKTFTKDLPEKDLRCFIEKLKNT